MVFLIQDLAIGLQLLVENKVIFKQKEFRFLENRADKEGVKIKNIYHNRGQQDELIKDYTRITEYFYHLADLCLSDFLQAQDGDLRELLYGVLICEYALMAMPKTATDIAMLCDYNDMLCFKTIQDYLLKAFEFRKKRIVCSKKFEMPHKAILERLCNVDYNELTELTKTRNGK